MVELDTAQAPGADHRGFPLVGRERELKLILTTLEHPPAVVMLEGEAGIGKSRLVHEATVRITARDGRVLHGACHPLREPQPYGPIVDALRDTGHWLPPVERIDPAAHALGPLLPGLVPLLPLPPLGAGAGRPERRQTVQAVRAVLDALAPVVLVVEDVHWADEATREMLLLLAHDLPPQAGLLLTYRPEELPTGRPVLGSAFRPRPGTYGADISLPPLREEHLRELATFALGAERAARLGRALFQRSAGIPLIAEEDLLTLRERDQHDQEQGSAQPPGLSGAEVPRALREAVLERLLDLPEDAAALVEAAAVLAVPAQQELLAATAELPEERAAQALTSALQASVLYETLPTRYGFRHTLAQQVVYQHIVGPRREALHRSAVRELWRQDAPPLVQIAHHAKALGDRRAWIQHACAAADQAVELGDEGTAAELLHELLAEPGLDSELRTRSSLALGRIAINQVGFESTIRALRSIVDDPGLAPGVRGEIRLTLGLLVLNQSRDGAGVVELERAVQELSARPELAARAMVALATHSSVHIGHQTAERSMAWMARAEQTIADSPDQAARAAVRASRLTLMAEAGDPAVWALLDELPRHAEDQEVLRQTIRALCNAGDSAMDLGHDERAAALLAESEELGVRIGSTWLQCLSAMNRITLDWHRGRWEGLQERCAALSARFPDVPAVALEAHRLAGQMAAAQGQWDRAARQFAQVSASGGNYIDFRDDFTAAAALGQVRLAQSDPEAAWAVVAPQLDVLRLGGRWPQSRGLVPVGVEVTLGRGDRETAERLVDDYRQGLRGCDAPHCAAEVDLCRGLLTQEQDPAAAAEHFTRAERGFQQIGRPYPAAQAAEKAARALLGTDPDAGSARLGAAEKEYTRLGATSGAAHCRQTLRELGQSPSTPRGRRGYGEQLSPREAQVATLLREGATNQQIAQALFISPRTAEHHVASVLKKLGLTNREAARSSQPLDS